MKNIFYKGLACLLITALLVSTDITNIYAVNNHINENKKDLKIEIKLIKEKYDSYNLIYINDIKIDIPFFLEDFKIINLDNNSSNKLLVVFDKGLSNDKTSFIFNIKNNVPSLKAILPGYVDITKNSSDSNNNSNILISAYRKETPTNINNNSTKVNCFKDIYEYIDDDDEDMDLKLLKTLDYGYDYFD